MTQVERKSRGSRFVAYALIGIMLTAMGYGMGVWSAPVTSFGIDGSGNFHGNEVHVNDVVSEGDVHTSSLYVNGYYPGNPGSYTVGVDGATYWARNEATGVVTTNANFVTLIQAACNAVSDVYIKEGTYVYGTTPITPNAFQHIHGAGEKTILSSTTASNAFNIINNNVEINDLAIKTSMDDYNTVIVISNTVPASSVDHTYLHDLYITDSSPSGGHNFSILFTATGGTASGICFSTLENIDITGTCYGITLNPANDHNFITGALFKNIFIRDFTVAAVRIVNGHDTTYGTNYNIFENFQIQHSTTNATSGIYINGFAYGNQFKNLEFWGDGGGAFTTYNIATANANLTNVFGGHVEGHTVTDGGTGTVIRSVVDYPGVGETRWNSAKLEAWNSTAWVIIGP